MHESFVHDCLKAYVCVLYDSPCAPLLLPWLGEVEGTSLAMSQAKASPVPAHVPMFRVPTVLRRVPSAVPQTVVGQRFWLRPFKNGQGLPTCSRFGKVHSLQPTECTFQPGACIHGPFSNAGRQCTGALSKSTICNENDAMTRATRLISLDV